MRPNIHKNYMVQTDDGGIEGVQPAHATNLHDDKRHIRALIILILVFEEASWFYMMIDS